MPRFSLLLAALLALAACHGADPARTASPDSQGSHAYAGIDPRETVRLTGTEPFWGGTIAGSTMTYTTPETPGGETLPVARFAGRGGVSWSGTLDGARFAVAVTPGACSDGMSDRRYPFVVTLAAKGAQRSGCGWTDRNGFTGP